MGKEEISAHVVRSDNEYYAKAARRHPSELAIHAYINPISLLSTSAIPFLIFFSQTPQTLIIKHSTKRTPPLLTDDTLKIEQDILESILELHSHQCALLSSFRVCSPVVK